MPGQAPKRPSTYTVPCRCGTYHIVAVAVFGRLQTCNKCKSGYTVMWKKDPKSGAQSPMVVASARRTIKPPKPGPSPESLIQLACACGYRRKATADELRKLPKCPGCGKPMYVDRPARQKPSGPLGPSTPFIERTRYSPSGRYLAPAAPTPSMTPKVGPFTEAAQKTPPSTPRPEPVRARAEARTVPGGKSIVVCTMCGDRLLVRDLKPGRVVKCLRCDSPMTVQTSPPSMEAAVFDVPPAAPEPVSEPTPPPAPPKRTPRPPPAFANGPTMGCPCGETIDIRGAGPGSVFTCPSCGRNATMQKAKHPQTLQTVMKPLFDAEPPPEPEAQEILCECGEALTVTVQDLGHPVQCPGCAMLMGVEKEAGALKVKPLGRIDEQTLDWQDFK